MIELRCCEARLAEYEKWFVNGTFDHISQEETLDLMADWRDMKKELERSEEDIGP